MKKSKKFTLTAFLSILLLGLTSCDTEEISDRIVTLVQNMLPNIWITLMQLALFIIVVILFIVFAYKPLKKKLFEMKIPISSEYLSLTISLKSKAIIKTPHIFILIVKNIRNYKHY